MSWFSDLTSKAEAMLMKLDKDAAQALQKDNLQIGKDILNQAINTVTSTYLEDDKQEPLLQDHQEIEETSHTNTDNRLIVSLEQSHIPNTFNHLEESVNNINQEQLHDATTTTTPQGHIGSEEMPNPASQGVQWQVKSTSSTEIQRPLNGSEVSKSANEISIEQSPSVESQGAKKFKLQTSRLRSVENSKNRYEKKARVSRNNNGRNLKIPGADDIRASINRTLQEYSYSYRGDHGSSREPSQVSYFDDQPNLIQIPNQNELDSSFNGPADAINRNRNSSQSFSINVPENQPSSCDIASRLIGQSVKKKSTFSLHQVINKLANQGVSSKPLIGEKTRLRLRRFQIRAASYARRLNHYFRANPAMKYWLVGYIVIMQLLVIYVLFFYQFSGSTTYLSSQIEKQQETLNEERLGRPDYGPNHAINH